jgi:hypothetical protein
LLKLDNVAARTERSEGGLMIELYPSPL